MASELEWHTKTQGGDEWEEIIAPIDCNYYAISSESGELFYKCSDQENIGTCRQIPTGGSFAILAPFISFSSLNEVRWKQGDHITWVKSASPLDLYFLR